MVRDRRSPGEGPSAGTTAHTSIGPGKRTLVSELDAERGGGPGKHSLVERIPQAQLKARDDGDQGGQADARRSEALPAPLASEMGKSLGADLSGVRIHTGDGVADEYGAYAVTLNSDIHFESGKYDPSSTQGKTLIAHEVAHTVQQGASPTTQKAEGSGSTGALEQEADAAASSIVSGKPARVATATGGAPQRKAMPKGNEEDENYEPALPAVRHPDAIGARAEPPAGSGAAPAAGTTPAAGAAPAAGTAPAAAAAPAAGAAPAADAPPTAGAAHAPAKPAGSSAHAPAGGPAAAASAAARSPAADAAAHTPGRPASAAPATAHPAAAPAPPAPAAASGTGITKLDGNARNNPAAVATLAAATQHAAAVRQAAATLVAQKHAEFEARKQAFHAGLEQHVSTVEAAFEASKQQLLAHKTQAAAAIQQAAAAHTAEVAAHQQAETARLHAEADNHKTAAAAHVDQAAAAAAAHGDTEASRATQESETRAAGAGEGAPAPSGDPPVVEAQSNANTKTAAQAATNFRADGSKLSSESRQAAGQLSSSMTQQHAQFAAKIDAAAIDSAHALGQQGADAQHRMATSAHGSQQSTAALCDQSIAHLDEQRAHAVAAMRESGAQTVAHLTKAHAASTAQITQEAHAAAHAIEHHGSRVAQSIGSLQGEHAQTEAATAQAALQQDSAAVHTRLTAAGVELATASDGVLRHSHTQLGQVAQAHGQAAHQAAATIGEKVTVVRQGSVVGLAEASAKTRASITTSVTTSTGKMGEGRAQFCGAIDQHAQRGQGEISKQVSDGLIQQQTNQQTVASKRNAAGQQIGSKYDQLQGEAQTRSKAEQDANASTGAQRWSLGGLWNSFTSTIKGWLTKAFGDFWGGLVWGLLSGIVQLVICIAILAVIAAIFTPFVALVVGICALVVFAGLGIKSRYDEFKANNGRSPGFGEWAGLVGLGIADITGIPQIVEGIVGKRAFSNGHTLTDFQRGELIGGGVVQLAATVAMVAGLVTGKPTVKPGDIDLKPGDIKPGDVKPDDVKPDDAKPADPAAARLQKLNELADKLEVDFKNDPLRAAYEEEVNGLKGKADALIKERGTDPAALEQTARDMVKARRDLGVKYKDKTPEPLRDYIYDMNMQRYGDPLGPSFEFLMDKYKGDFMKIIDASTRPNPDINSFMSGFRKWLLEGTHGDKYLPKDDQPRQVIPPPPTQPSQRDDHN